MDLGDFNNLRNSPLSALALISVTSAAAVLFFYLSTLSLGHTIDLDSTNICGFKHLEITTYFKKQVFIYLFGCIRSLSWHVRSLVEAHELLAVACGT